LSLRDIDIDAGNRGAGFGKRDRDGPADAAAGAADQGRFPRQIHRLSSLGFNPGHSITVPPSTAMVCPVMNSLASDRSHVTVPARSPGTRLRWMVCCVLIACS